MENRKRSRVAIPRTVALCYIRQSFTRTGEPDDLNSPERQRANIQVACDKNAWTPEWYEDVGGHRSGRSEKNRPAWLALKARLNDPDVIALVANDLSRIHRKGWRIGDLIDFLDQRQVNLILAAPGREVDTTTAKGRMFVQVGAMIDEFYAEDISTRAKDSIEYRKAQGKTVGLPPFGTTRDPEGFLVPTLEGAWLLETGRHVAGTSAESPAENAMWRGYHNAADRVLKLYASKGIGFEKIAYKINDEGWAFRDRSGSPRPFDRDDIRRVVSSWPEYGGILAGSRGKDRHAYEKVNVDEIVFRPDRAIFPIPLLRAVAQARQVRSVRPIDQSVKRKAHAYPLSALTYCAHCERLADEHSDARRRSLLSGNLSAKGVFLYRHKLGVRCGAHNRSVPCEFVERDFQRLLQLLTVREDAQDIMAGLAIEMGLAHASDDPNVLEREKREAIALCRRRIEAAVVLYGDGMIDKEDYRRRVEVNEREIVHWESRTSEIQKISVEFAMCVDALERLVRLWDNGADEDKQGLARTLFTEVVYDLDTQRIVSFKLKPWADRFLTVRAAFFGKEDDDNTTPTSSGNSEGNEVAEKPLGGIALPTSRECGFSVSWPVSSG